MFRGLALLAALAAACGPALPSDAPQALARAQFGGHFHPAHAPYGGFGGADDCTPHRTPVILLHGNTESADDWLRADSHGGPSAPARLAAAGYNACELFAVTWLAPQGRTQKLLHFHDEANADLVGGFIRDVLAYTGAKSVDLIGHSMGVTVALHALDRGALWSRVRRFVSIAGALRGVESCLSVGPANPLAPACGSQNVFDSDVFGFYPFSNPRMEAGGFRDRPAQHPAVTFASIGAGASDEILCPGCDSALFDTAPNVRAQLDVGVGAPAEGDHDDTSGVGHYRARRDTGAIQANLLTSECTGAACCKGYVAHCDDSL
jgi:pimeloyl-ACP methyl ester carboxylesterase